MKNLIPSVAETVFYVVVLVSSVFLLFGLIVISAPWWEVVLVHLGAGLIRAISCSKYLPQNFNRPQKYGRLLGFLVSGILGLFVHVLTLAKSKDGNQKYVFPSK